MVFGMRFDPPILNGPVIGLGLAKVPQGFYPGMLHPIPNWPSLSPRQDTGRRHRACAPTQFYQCHQNSLWYAVVQKAYPYGGKGTVGLVRGYFGGTVRVPFRFASYVVLTLQGDFSVSPCEALHPPGKSTTEGMYRGEYSKQS
jgi:hypothetical protein